MKLETILVGIDFSDASELVLDQALLLARRSGAKLWLAHASMMPESPITAPASMEATLTEYERILQQHLENDQRQLTELAERISEQGVDVSHRVVADYPEKALCALAREINADLTVVGSHGRTGIKRFLLGSVAERVVRLNEHHVLVARGGGPAPDAGGYRKLLVTTDFSPLATQALRAAIALAAPEAEIDLLHCWHLPPVTYAPAAALAELAQSLRDNANKLAAEVVAEHERPGLRLRTHIVDAVASRGIVDWLEQHNYELVVTGSHGRRGWRRFLLGSVAETTVRHAPVSVLVIHGSESDQETATPPATAGG